MVNSIDSSSDVTVKSPRSSNAVKFLCSYGGKILPRHPDGKLRYFGGETRVVSVDRSISFAELLLKLGEVYGSAVSFRCQLPEEDLDALVSITSDEDLTNIIEEYDLASQASASPLKIRAFLWPPKSIKKASPTPSATSSSTADSSTRRYFYQHQSSIGSRMLADRFIPPPSSPIGYPIRYERSARTKLCYYTGVPQANPRHSRLVHNGNHWQ